MSHHLSDDECIDAIDRTLTSARREHLDHCEQCRASVAALEAVVGDVASSHVPEPSPLFWDHLSARIREATRDIPARTPWWQGHWRSLVAASAAAVLVVVASWRLLVPAALLPVATNATRLSDAPVESAAADENAWQTVGDLATALSSSALSSDDVQLVVAAGPMAPPAMAELTPREREAFVKLLSVEMDRGDLGGAH